MGTATSRAVVPQTLTIEEYLNSSYRPDCDFVDDHIEERHLGTTKHGFLQAQLCIWFGIHRKQWRVCVVGDVRTRTGQTRVRLPDVAVIWEEELDLEERAMTRPPLIAIEILSPEDRMSRMVPRLREFVAMGVPHVWLIDPIERLTYVMTEGEAKLASEPRLTVPGTPIYLDLPELFSALD